VKLTTCRGLRIPLPVPGHVENNDGGTSLGLDTPSGCLWPVFDVCAVMCTTETLQNGEISISRAEIAPQEFWVTPVLADQ